MRERLSQKDSVTLEQARHYHMQGCYPQAEASYQSLLRKYPTSSSIQNLLGALMIDRGDPADAIPLLKRATRHNKKDANNHYNLGLALAETGKHEDAIKAYRRAISIEPRHNKAHYNLGHSLRKLERDLEAVAALERDYALEARFDTCRALARTLMKLEDYDGALTYANRCVELEGAGLEDLNLLVLLLCRKYALAATITPAQIDELTTLAHHAVNLSPSDVAALVNLGRALSQLGDFGGALAPLKKAVQLDPEHDSAHSLYGIALLTEGELEQGWHERTLLSRMQKPVTPTGVPRWSGELEAGMTLWVTREQGVGDQFLYARMLKDLVDAGIDVTLVCEERVMPILARSMPGVHLTTRITTDEQAGYDAFASLGELHLHLRRSMNDIPTAIPYLRPDAVRTGEFRARYSELYPDKRVTGLAWLSHSDVNGAGKSVPLDDLLPILTMPDRVFVCVQYGRGWDELRKHAAVHGYMVHFDEDCNSLDDLDLGAAQLAALDELVSVSNASVHMAGAMGVRCHVLVGQRPVWHWFSATARPDHRSPWYTDVNLYRQQELASWATPIAELKAAIETQGPPPWRLPDE